MKSVAYTPVLLWALTTIVLSGCSPDTNKLHALNCQPELPPASVMLKTDYIDNDASLLSSDLSEEFINIQAKTYSF